MRLLPRFSCPPPQPPTHGVYFVDEDDAGRFLLGGGKEGAHAAGAHPHKHLVKLAASPAARVGQGAQGRAEGAGRGGGQSHSSRSQSVSQTRRLSRGALWQLAPRGHCQLASCNSLEEEGDLRLPRPQALAALPLARQLPHYGHMCLLLSCPLTCRRRGPPPPPPPRAPAASCRCRGGPSAARPWAACPPGG